MTNYLTAIGLLGTFAFMLAYGFGMAQALGMIKPPERCDECECGCWICTDCGDCHHCSDRGLLSCEPRKRGPNR